MEVYELSLRLASDIYTVVELIAGVERFFLRDQLDRKSTVVPQLVKQALACESMVERRAVYVKARRVALDCLAVLDVLGTRGTIEAEALAIARKTAQALIDMLAPLTVPPPLAR
jgi:hypothetical protein